MSVTEVIHKQVNKVSTSRRFLLPTDADQGDHGLVMKIDSNLKESKGSVMKNPSAVQPSAVSSQLCGQGHEVTGWVLRGVLFIQTTHIPFIKFTHRVTETVQKKAKLLMPIFLYLSLLVLVAQASAVVFLLSAAAVPIGMIFLLSCIGILAVMFIYTIVRGNPHNTHTKSSFKLL